MKQSSGLISVMGTLHQGNQQSSTCMPNSDAAVQTPMTLNALVTHNQHVIPKNITKVHKIVLGDRKLKLREIADILKISEGSVFIVSHESFGMSNNGWNMDPPLHTWNKKIISLVDRSWWKPSKATKNSIVGWQSYGIRIVARAWYFVYRLS